MTLYVPKEKMFTNNDGSSSITAGSKMAFSNMIFAKQQKGWTPAAKILAVTYFDLSEKLGYAFARRKYLQFRTKTSFDTISTANRIIEASGLFSIKYRANNSLWVTPNPDAIEAAYQKYVADHAEFKRLEAEWWNPDDERDEESDSGTETTSSGVDGNSIEVGGNSDEGSRKIGRGLSENPSRNPSIHSLHQNPPSKRSSFRTRSAERVKTRSGSRKGRPSGSPAGDDDLRQFIAELHTILPDHEPFDGDDDRKPFNAKRSRQGELPQLRKLVRAGWTKEELRDMIENYVTEARDEATNYDPTFKTLASIFGELLYKTQDQNRFEGDEEFYGRRLPERFLYLSPPEKPVLFSPTDDQSTATEGLDAQPTQDDDAGRWVFTPDDIARHTAEQVWP